MCGDSCLGFGRVSDVFRRTAPEGTVTTVGFSLGLELWECQISLAIPAGVSVSETVRMILSASGTGIQLLSFPGEDPFFTRGQAFCGRAADCITEALSRVWRSAGNTEALSQAWCGEGYGGACAQGYLVPAGLCIIPAESRPATLHLTEKDLTDRPVMADGGKKMILCTTVTGFQAGEEMTLEYMPGNGMNDLSVLESIRGESRFDVPWRSQGMILERLVDTDTGSGPWRTELLVELRGAALVN